MKSHLQRNALLSIRGDHSSLLRLNKIICTIGPKTQDVESLKGLIKEGMNIARLNFSHGNHDFHATTITNVRQAAKEMGNVHVALALDTKGPEIRTGMFTNEETEVKAGSRVTVTTDKAFEKSGTAEKIFVDYDRICAVVSQGGHIFIDDGILDLVIESVDPASQELKCVAANSHTLTSRRGVNLPGAPVDLPAVSERDLCDLQFAAEQQVDMIFASFIRSPHQVQQVRSALGEKGKSILVIAKIENQQGVDLIDEIINESDGIMVARGDLGVEIAAEKVTVAQKVIIAKCMILGKPAVCATQMLESMTQNPRPTRAEVSDVANAVLDGADCVMLSGETAKGNYPNEVVRYMARICREAQNAMRGSINFWAVKDARQSMLPCFVAEEGICCSAVSSAFELDAKAIITISNTGVCPRTVAMYCPCCPILCASQHLDVCRKMCIVRGVVPVFYDTALHGEDPTREKRVNACIEEGKALGLLHSNDIVVIVHADHKTKGSANQTKVIRLPTL